MAYCDTAAEQEKNPEARYWFTQMANGDEDAFRFMWTFWSFTHLYDDLVDRDRPVTAEQAAGEFVSLLTTLLYNPFFVQHKDTLFPMIVSMFNRWVDGDLWEQSDQLFDQVASSVIRCGDVDLYHIVAFLTGGWDNMRRTHKARSYDINDSLKAKLKE